MIIRRYISKQVLGSAAAVTLVLTVILMSGRVIKYFGMAADGRMDVKLLTAVLVYRLPGFLDLIVPLGLFIGVLLTFGRLYLDNEMSVLHASGVSRASIVGHLVAPMLVVMGVVAFTSFYVTPTGNAAAERLFAEQAQKNTFDLVRPGRFQDLPGKRVLYAAALSEDRQQLIDVRLFESKRLDANGKVANGSGGAGEARADGGAAVPPAERRFRHVLVAAETGRTRRDAATGERFLVLEDGVRYELVTGQGAYRQIRFDRYELRLPEPEAIEGAGKLGSYSTARLMAEKDRDPLVRGEWLWRLSLPLFVPVATLLAFSLSRVNPRQGRYLKLLPAILLYLSYVVAIGAARKAIEKGKGADAVVWLIHVGYFLLALGILGHEQLRLQFRQWRAARGTPA